MGGGRLGTMGAQRPSLSLGRWSLWLLLLGLVLPSSSAQALSYREAMLCAVGQLMSSPQKLISTASWS